MEKNLDANHKEWRRLIYSWNFLFMSEILQDFLLAEKTEDNITICLLALSKTEEQAKKIRQELLDKARALYPHGDSKKDKPFWAY
jgi:serine/threonine protein phosphatase PrpC